MKTRLLIIATAFALILPINLVYAPPSVNPDWPEYPYCPGGCSREILVDEWAQYYDMKGQEWMEKKRAELFDAYANGTLDEWIDSDPSKANQNTYTYYYILGEIPNSDGEYYVVIPSCVDGVYVSDDAICSTGDLPPCPEPSFRKNGMCVVEKKSLCGDNTVLKNYKCIPDQNQFRVDDPDFKRQSLQTGESISNPEVIIVIQSLGAGLIVLFIIIYAIKKWRSK